MTDSRLTREMTVSAPDRCRLQRSNDRGISTVVDVSLCLLLITASIAVLAVFLADERAVHDPTIADETAQTIATSTTTIEYSVRSVERRDDTGVFDDAAYDDGRYDRVEHGSLAQLLAAAALSNVSLDGEPLSHAGLEFRDAVDANVRSELAGANDDVHLLARWEPYPSASIRGESTAGDRPPASADVSTVTFSVSSGFPSVSDDDLEGTYDAENGSFERTAEPIADAILDGYFPHESTTVALQGSDLERDLTRYEYLRFESILDLDRDLEHNELNRTAVDIAGANEKLAANLTETIAADLEETFEPEIAEIESELEAEYPADEEPVTSAVDDLVRSSVATDEVLITVRVWDE
ncbi:hypothetical protein EA462_02615 [Natrarchaeobius halalkaliphilus]|uniref:Uncharacterized protein n=1 Tax=Natrarchaeobius halalkaliphilus TaxID=1679091 RepID=A0A3N6MGM4_9EURY|nr:hypothetical protein [Natrarchaeobius halalkaliphilus]RQG93116.1 hypothetical protein EA462_02615 [Natrarchaeobius halalkaliphilus]